MFKFLLLQRVLDDHFYHGYFYHVCESIKSERIAKVVMDSYVFPEFSCVVFVDGDKVQVLSGNYDPEIPLDG